MFFDSLEDDTETAESASEAAEGTSEAVGEKERIEENVVKESSDKGNSSSGDEPKDENEQIIRVRLMSHRFLRKAFLQDLSTGLNR